MHFMMNYLMEIDFRLLQYYSCSTSVHIRSYNSSSLYELCIFTSAVGDYLRLQFPNVADLAAQLGHFSCVSCHKHLDKKEQFPAAVILGRWRGRVDTHDNKGSALVRVCPIWPRLLQLSLITNKKN